jgi:hypothetical protein
MGSVFDADSSATKVTGDRAVFRNFDATPSMDIAEKLATDNPRLSLLTIRGISVREKAQVNSRSSSVRRRAHKGPNRLALHGFGIHSDIPIRRRHSVLLLKQQGMFLHRVLRPLRLSSALDKS